MAKTFVEDGQTKRTWVRVGKLTTSQATLGTNGLKARVEALTATGLVIYDVPHDASAGSFRFHNEAEAADDVIEVWAIRGDDHYQLIQILEITGGAQKDGDVGVFIDTLVFSTTSEVWPTAMAANSAVNDSIAMLSLNFHGYDRLLFIATTLAASCAIDAVVL